MASTAGCGRSTSSRFVDPPLEAVLDGTEAFRAHQGVKFLPPGLHFFVFSAAPSAVQQEHLAGHSSQGVATRHGILRFYRGAETVVEEWDNVQEELKRDALGQAPRKRRRNAVEQREETVVSDEYLKSLDPSLAAYPQDEIAAQWAELTNFVTEETLARVVGLDEHGCGLVDALTGSTLDEPGASGATSGKRTWGKAREEEPEVRVVVEEEEEDDGVSNEPVLLEFAKFDVKRSWPEGAVGEALTRWSRDKSWQLSHVVREQLKDGASAASVVDTAPNSQLSHADPKELLGELQLAFVLFSLLHNFSSLTVYKSIVSLICRSATLVQPPPVRPPSAALPSPLLSDASLPLFASFLSVFLAQVQFLEGDFFATQLPSLERDLLDSLSALSQALSDSLTQWTAIGEKEPGTATVWKEVVKRWDDLAAATMERFGWDLGVIKGTRAEYLVQGGRVERAEDEVDLEDLEEGEDAPYVVDDEGLRGGDDVDEYY